MCVVMKKLVFLLLLLPLISGSMAQTDPFQITLNPMTLPGLPGIQAYAFGQHDGLWLIIGGRLDGLHRRQPWATFDPDGRNRSLLVIDPVQKQFWTAPLTSLSLPLQDQLSATNMEFFQKDTMLYLVGGYGHSETVGSKLTYAMLTAVNIPGVIRAVIEQTDLTPYFRFQTDPYFAVTGGHLEKIDDVMHLVGGQKFDGNYNPMNHPSFTQEYTNGVRRFLLQDDGTTMLITKLPSLNDTAAFHRRDFNVGPQILPGGEEAIMSFAGPFRTDADLPYLNNVLIEKDSYFIVPDFAQYFNHYHCPILPMFEASSATMQTVFFGGIAQYYMEGDVLVQDQDVPFVSTIARIERTPDGRLTEYKLPVSMPGYLGASAEFIRLEGIPTYPNGVVKLDELPTDAVLIGYIFGGIESTAPNIFWINEGTESSAHAVIYEVYLNKNSLSQDHLANPQSQNGLQLQVYPNPAEDILYIRFHLDHPAPVDLQLTDMEGKTLLRKTLKEDLMTGENVIIQKCKSFKPGGIYLLTLTIEGKSVTQQILVKE